MIMSQSKHSQEVNEDVLGSYMLDIASMDCKMKIDESQK